MRVDAGRCARVYEVVDGRPRTVAVEVDGHAVAVDGPEVTVTVRGRRWSDADLEPSDRRTTTATACPGPCRAPTSR